MDLADSRSFKAQVRASFDTTPPTYGAPGDYHWAFAQRLVQRAPVAPGQRVLDVATGTAPAALLAAEVAGPTGQVVGLDLSPGILAIARHNISAARRTNVQVLVSDAERLAVATGQFDGVLCSSSIVWFPNIPSAVREWWRVLRPGGWIAFSCFGGGARATRTALLSRLLESYGQVLPEVNAPLNTPTKCRQLVEAAGFERVTITTAEEQRLPTVPDASFEEVWAGRNRYNIALASEQVAQLKAAYAAALVGLLPTQNEWNHDYEQFVVAYRAN